MTGNLNVFLGNMAGYYETGSNRLIFGGGGNDVLQVTSADVLPWATNTSALGSSTLKWTVVYATNGTLSPEP